MVLFAVTFVSGRWKLLLSELTPLSPQRKKGTLAKDGLGRRTNLIGKLRSCAYLSVMHRCVPESTFGRLGVMNALASWLAQVGSDVLLGV